MTRLAFAPPGIRMNAAKKCHPTLELLVCICLAARSRWQNKQMLRCARSQPSRPHLQPPHLFSKLIGSAVLTKETSSYSETGVGNNPVAQLTTLLSPKPEAQAISSDVSDSQGWWRNDETMLYCTRSCKVASGSGDCEDLADAMQILSKHIPSHDRRCLPAAAAADRCRGRPLAPTQQPGQSCTPQAAWLRSRLAARKRQRAPSAYRPANRVGTCRAAPLQEGICESHGGNCSSDTIRPASPRLT